MYGPRVNSIYALRLLTLHSSDTVHGEITTAGAEVDHPDLNIVEVVDFFDSPGDTFYGQDGNGHGTHVAGTESAETFRCSIGKLEINLKHSSAAIS